MRVLVTGADGQLGHDVVIELTSRGHSCAAVDRGEFDLTNEKAVRGFVDAFRPDAVVHCAAYTAVDMAEDCVAECYAVNVDGTKNLCKAISGTDAKLVYISTDYVFNGEKDEPYEVGDSVDPQTVYGITKSGGENAVRRMCSRHFIIRTAWVFGSNGKNFVKTMLRLGAEKENINVVCDQFGSPTYTPDLARLIGDMLETERYGTYHATNEGFCSWADFACEIMQQGRLNCRVVPIPSTQYPAKAKRPRNSRLSKASLSDNGFNLLPPWQEALAKFLEKIQ